ncbi:hypothetical protein [Bradyrhizobium australiense]|uniref:Uncharacterized protein n=1 Tax=Bradyrhizobium australiense TaxID=2721161 RepID=A0A7Y4GXS9_9BRAD|nr:hypothetical protein [Bradyrhizobium australiense]NOJ43332.1 hypothetical protein [Bradyrhizobium australiense]
MTMMMRACAIGFLAILAMPLGASAQSERTGYKKVSPLGGCSRFCPGTVQPKEIPDGPFRGFDVRGRLSSTIYMHTRYTHSRRPKRVAVHISDRRKSERTGYKKVSSLVDFPSFFPGIGELYVQPEKLPNGPYRAFDRRGRLSSTIYMLPIEDLQNRKQFDLEGLAGTGDHVTVYFNSGHPGLDKPHYHIHIWHVSKKGEERVAK